MKNYQNNKKLLREALISCFRSYDDMKIFASDSLDIRLAEISSSSEGLEVVAYELIEYLESRGSLEKASQILKEEFPKNKHVTMLIDLNKEGEENMGEQNLLDKFLQAPLFVKIGFGVMLSAMIVAGIVEIPKLSVNDDLSLPQDKNINSKEENVFLEILVLSESGASVEGVTVRVLSTESSEPQITNTSGTVRIAVSPNDSIEVILQKKGFKTSVHPIDLENDPSSVRRFTLLAQE
jgi:hypothetical protein